MNPIGSPLGNRRPLLLGFVPSLPDYSMFYQDANSRASMAMDAFASSKKAADERMAGLVPNDFQFKGLPIDYASDQLQLSNELSSMKDLVARSPNPRAAISSPEYMEHQRNVLQLTNGAVNEQRDLYKQWHQKYSEEVTKENAGSDVMLAGDPLSVGVELPGGEKKVFSVPASLNEMGTGVLTNQEWMHGRAYNEDESIRGRGTTLTGQSPVVSYNKTIEGLEKSINSEKLDSNEWLTEEGLKRLNASGQYDPLTSVTAAISATRKNSSNERQVLNSIRFAEQNMGQETLNGLWSGWTQSPEFKELATRDQADGGFLVDDGQGGKKMDLNRAFSAMFEPRFESKIGGNTHKLDFIGKTLYGIGSKYIQRRNEIGTYDRYIIKPEEMKNLDIGDYVNMMMEGRVSTEKQQVGVQFYDPQTGQKTNFIDNNASVGNMGMPLTKQLNFRMGLIKQKDDIDSKTFPSAPLFLQGKTAWLPDGTPINTPDNPINNAYIVGATGKIVTAPKLEDGYLQPGAMVDANGQPTGDPERRGYYEIQMFVPEDAQALKVSMPRALTDQAIEGRDYVNVQVGTRKRATPAHGGPGFVDEPIYERRYLPKASVDEGGKPMTGAAIEQMPLDELGVGMNSERDRWNKAWSTPDEPAIQRGTYKINGVEQEGDVIRVLVPIDESFSTLAGVNPTLLKEKGWINSPNMRTSLGASMQAVQEATTIEDINP